MHSRTQLLLLIIFISMNLSVEGQCDVVRLDGVYKRKLIGEVDLNLYNIASVAKTDSGITVNFDTLYKEILTTETVLNKKYVLQETIMNHDSTQYLILNTETDKSYNLNIYYNRRYVDFINTDSFFYFSTSNKAIAFNYADESLKEIFSEWSRIVGYDHNDVYVAIGGKLKIGKEKYYQSTILKLNNNGYSIANPQLKKKYFTQNKLIYYNSDYVLENRYTYSEEINCNNYQHFYSNLYFQGKLCDSTVFTTQNLYLEKATWKNDTLSVSIGDVDRKYFEGKMVEKINTRDSIAQHPLLQNERFLFTTKDDILFALCEYGRFTTIGLTEDGSQTFNGMLMKPEYFTYEVMLAFDKNTFEFLGYPTIHLLAK